VRFAIVPGHGHHLGCLSKSARASLVSFEGLDGDQSRFDSKIAQMSA
jgi:hypothetical protein